MCKHYVNVPSAHHDWIAGLFVLSEPFESVSFSDSKSLHHFLSSGEAFEITKMLETN